jgi:hypothetical protein
MNLNNNIAAILMISHSALSLTSLVYHIPKTRNKTAPMIYPEYRLHSIIFALRSVVCYFLIYWRFSIIYNFVACYATMLLADIVTAMYQDNDIVNKTTMRDMPFDKRITITDQNEIIRMQSSQQIGATILMFGNLDSCFSPIFTIQIAAFLMTLVRKSIIDSNMWHFGYNVSLWMNIFCYWSLPIGHVIIHPIIFNTFYFWRFSVNKNAHPFIGNKYIGWSVVFGLFYFYNQNIFLQQKITDVVLQNNMDMYIRILTIFGYLTTQIYKSKGLLVVFRPKT